MAFHKRLKIFGCILAILMITGCASTKTEDPVANSEISDPIEPVNRVFFDFNIFLDRWLLRPVTRFYVNVVPEFLRLGIHNILDTVRLPVVAVNDLLQGEIERFGQTVGRFTVNVATGFGILDTAGELAPGHEEDLGQTLAVWGVPGGPYLVLPFLGPTNIRDSIATAAETYGEPLGWVIDRYYNDTILYSYSGGRTALTILDKRAQVLGQIEELEKTSLDFYATIRSLYVQKRRDEIRNGDETDPLPIPEITFEPESEPKPVSQQSSGR
ncbi:MAG: VacJ family lipoprotein [Alphaproteobacteria bacterium]|nr:VacJ family lipoprotein [Alphaproteobacteria bacterium]